MNEIRLRVEGDVGDIEQSEQLSSRLRAELLEHDIEDVRRPSHEGPDGAKGDALAWAELVVSFSGSLPALVAAIRSWRGRQRGATITIERGDDRLILGDATAAEQTALVEEWLARHADG